MSGLSEKNAKTQVAVTDLSRFQPDIDVSSEDYTQHLKHLMQEVAIASFSALCCQADVSRWQVTRLRRGQLQRMRVEDLLKLAKVLRVSLADLITTFASLETQSSPAKSPNEPQPPELQTLKEYQRLEKQLEQQRVVLWQEFQQATLQTLESFLLQWPTAAYAAQQNPQVPAVRMLPLLRPVEQLLQTWEIETIGPVGVTVAYDPQIHQLMEGNTHPGNPVKIRYVGYCHAEKLLYRAKVSPVTPIE